MVWIVDCRAYSRDFGGEMPTKAKITMLEKTARGHTTCCTITIKGSYPTVDSKKWKIDVG